MPKDRVIEFFIIDILISVDNINRYFSNASYEKFITNQQTISAIMREFEIIGEALKYVLNHHPFSHLVDKRWREIIDFRNVISHAYFDINLQEIYDIICDDFPIFAHEFLEFAKKIKNENLIKILGNAKKDAQKLNYLETLEYLNHLENLLLNANIILEPIANISEEERWLFDPKNKDLVDELKQALKQKADKTIDLSAFEEK